MPSTVRVWKSEIETFEMRSRIFWPTLAVTSELTFWDVVVRRLLLADRGPG